MVYLTWTLFTGIQNYLFIAIEGSWFLYDTVFYFFSDYKMSISILKLYDKDLSAIFLPQITYK